ncbi:hypothetical protein BO78DRAFT_414119 [Aspergillus sclerotiicarbonarius CBS 121057]|uniref:Uncharacterized protein n=1 Tax=Aspergillus sclerotiicarbonarius (strain CBS 121057 / IBT 28362) TaxID=1448318 RepID=A0A319EL49_ASPSB|nr:hypothetical protein BO78DRAFT_414119 [Aspergillus sclerotiicarbonarius CBS 121057]
MTYPNTDTSEDYNYTATGLMSRRLRETFPDHTGSTKFIVLRTLTPMEGKQEKHVVTVQSEDYGIFLTFLTCDNVASSEYEKLLHWEMERTLIRRDGVPVYGITQCDEIVRFYRWKCDATGKGRLEKVRRGERETFDNSVGKEYDEGLEMLEEIKQHVMATPVYG